MQSSFLFHLTRLSHSNAWPGTASIYIDRCTSTNVLIFSFFLVKYLV
jgi:hypothetical protein